MSHARLALNTHALQTPLAHASSHDAILDAATEGILQIDLNGRIAYANQAAAAMFGLAVDEILDRPIRSHIQFLGSRGGTDHAAEVGVLNLNGLTLPRLGQETCWREDGTSFPIEYQCGPQIDAGRLVGAVLTFRDISRRRATDRLKDELIALTSHELRSPLTSIRSSLGLLAAGHGGDMSETGQRMLDIAVANTDRLIRLVNDLLDLERIEGGYIRMSRIMCDVGELMTQAADGVRAMAQQAGVSIEVLPSDAHLLVDPDRVLQVLTNLLANAIKFSPPTGGIIWIDAESADAELVIRVRDEGRGIPSAKLETIFNRFVQVDESDARDKGGTGLGLAISRSIVEQHGGQIWAESTVGVGTTLCVALPKHGIDATRLAAA